jgi:hypothetical protein
VNLGESGGVVRQIAEAERSSEQIERRVCEWQRQSVGFEENRLLFLPIVRGLGAGADDHLVNKIDADYLRTIRTGFVRENQSQISRTATQVENLRIGTIQHISESPGHAAAPDYIHAQR